MERRGCGVGIVQARANFGLKEMLCFFRRVRNSASKGIFVVGWLRVCTCEACVAPTALGIFFAIVPRPSGLG